MMHETRGWCLSFIASAEELASMLTERTWPLCDAFSVASHEQYLFLNDATSEDGAAEYAVVKDLGDSMYLQLDSITFSWCSRESATRHIERALAGEYDANDVAEPVTPVIEAPERHGRCKFCR